MGKCTSAVAISIRAKQFLREKCGSLLPDNQKWYVPDWNEEPIIIVREVKYLFKSKFLRWINTSRFATVVELVLNGEQASPSKKWILKVHGTRYFEGAKLIGERLAEHFNVEVHVCLFSELPGYIPCSDDY